MARWIATLVFLTTVRAAHAHSGYGLMMDLYLDGKRVTAPTMLVRADEQTTSSQRDNLQGQSLSLSVTAYRKELK